MTPKQQENNYQVFLAFIRFQEKRAKWPHYTDEELRVCYERFCRKEAYWYNEARRRRPPVGEITQGLPTLIAADIKRRTVGVVRPPPPRSSYRPGPILPKGAKGELPGSVPLP